MLDVDVGELLFNAASDALAQMEVGFKSHHALTVVLASEGYPKSAVKGRKITGAEVALDDSSTWISHAGTALDDSGNLVSSGGRVLSVTSIAASLEEAQRSAYQRLGQIHLAGSHHRTDIGHRALRS